MLQLFLGAYLEGSFQIALDRVNPAILSAFIKEDDSYLRKIIAEDQQYLGKALEVVTEIPQLEMSEMHVRSLLKKLLPDYPVETLPLYLISVNSDE